MWLYPATGAAVRAAAHRGEPGGEVRHRLVEHGADHRLGRRDRGFHVGAGLNGEGPTHGAPIAVALDHPFLDQRVDQSIGALVDAVGPPRRFVPREDRFAVLGFAHVHLTTRTDALRRWSLVRASFVSGPPRPRRGIVADGGEDCLP